jgi:hydrogenase nickel incorporation protein HypA/HybF
MHELSIAYGIVDIVRQFVKGPELERVRSVRLKVGEHSGVVVDSLEFSYTAITADTELKESRLEIERIPFVIECRSCRKRSETERGVVVCPDCGSTETTVVSGTELQVLDIEISENGSEVQ